MLIIFIFTIPQWSFVNKEIDAERALERGDALRALNIYIKLIKSKYFQNRLDSQSHLLETLNFMKI